MVTVGLDRPDRRNRAIRLARRPSGIPGDDCWDRADEPVPEPIDGELLVRIELLSIDPAMRGWMNDVDSYLPPVRVGAVMRAAGIGQVIESRNPRFSIGDYVSGTFGVQEYAISDGTGVIVVDPDTTPLASHLSVLGMTGMTAYFGLFDAGRLRDGETVVVTAAAGGVGSLVGQLAKTRDCRVIGIAGGAEKCRKVRALGFDECIDRQTDSVRSELAALCPDGIDVFFDNVGGAILEAGLAHLAHGARVVLCGAVSQYNEATMRGPSNYMQLLVKRASMTGFVVFDYARRFASARQALEELLRRGDLRSEEHVVTGLDNFPTALRSLFDGSNTGKLILRIDNEMERQ